MIAGEGVWGVFSFAYARSSAHARHFRKNLKKLFQKIPVIEVARDQ
jgi:hypothetical protein